MAENIGVSNNTEESQYEATIDGRKALAAYSRDGEKVTFTHTEVPPELEGRGIASKLVTAALNDCRQQNLRVVPQCVCGGVHRTPPGIQGSRRRRRLTFPRVPAQNRSKF
jgi:predicted GNAT family acetyltransferase